MQVLHQFDPILSAKLNSRLNGNVAEVNRTLFNFTLHLWAKYGVTAGIMNVENVMALSEFTKGFTVLVGFVF